MSKDTNTESTIVDSNNTIKERETYSFTISNKTNIEVAMQEYISNKIKSGTKMSSYIRYLIEKDMQENGIVVDGYSYSVPSNNSKSIDNNEIIDKLKSLEQMILDSSKYGGQVAYDKLVNIEFLLKNTSSNQSLVSPVMNNSVDTTGILNRLELITNLINTKENSSINYDLSFRDLTKKLNDIETILNRDDNNSNLNDIIEKLSDIEGLVSEQASNIDSKQIKILTTAITKLSEQIDLQTELIENLQDTVSNQNQLIKLLNKDTTRNSDREASVDVNETYDARRELAKKKAASMIESEL